jgi:hypothetical protein
MIFFIACSPSGQPLPATAAEQIGMGGSPMHQETKNSERRANLQAAEDKMAILRGPSLMADGAMRFR